jgi:hypothetical protein
VGGVAREGTALEIVERAKMLWRIVGALTGWDGNDGLG